MGMGVYVIAKMLDAHLANGTGRRTVTMAAPLLLKSGALRYEVVLHSCGTSPMGGGGYRLVTVIGLTRLGFADLPAWDAGALLIRPPQLVLPTVHSWQLYSSASPLGAYAASTTTQLSTQPHYPDTELTSSVPILIMPSTRSRKEDA